MATTTLWNADFRFDINAEWLHTDVQTQNKHKYLEFV